MKWLLILFFGIIVVPALAQTSQINQTDYQKLENSINELQIKLQQLNTSVNGLQTDHQKLDSSINEIRAESKNDYQNLSVNINYTRAVLQDEHKGSEIESFGFAVIPFAGGIIIAVVISRRHSGESKAIANTTKEVDILTKKIVSITSKQDQLLRDKQFVYAESIIQWIGGDVLDIEEFMETWYPRYQNTSDTEKETIRNNIISVYKLHLQTRLLPIKSIDLVEIFGKEIADHWLKLWIKCMIDVALFPNDPQGMDALKENFDEIVSQAKILKQKLDQFHSNVS